MESNIPHTICAIATSTGGALGIIRISGPKAIFFVSSLFHPQKGPSLSERKSHTLTYGEIRTPNNETIDEVLVSLFRAPHSYTGEDSVEISCHGSSYILQRILELLIALGCKMAKPGEFTLRAFTNKRMDLSQAEAVADLIASKSQKSHQLAINQLKGGFSHELKELKAQLVHLTSLIELELDFSDHEDLEFADRNTLLKISNAISDKISKLVNSFQYGNAIKKGIPIAIIGNTNAGKSTLLNALLNEEKAIVSDIHGTTRDIIEDTINIQGYIFRFIDTAGIRKTNDTIENLGIKKSFQAIEKSTIILLIHDITQDIKTLQNLYQTIQPHICNEQTVILVLNKCDLQSSDNFIKEKIRENIPEQIKTVSISAKNKEHIEQLQQILIKCFSQFTPSKEEAIITNARHYEALSKALEAINRVQKGLLTKISNDFISQDLRECIFYLSNIIGEITTDKILENIFSKFCVGK